MMQSSFVRSRFEESEKVKTASLIFVCAALLCLVPYVTAQQSGDKGISTNLPGVSTSPAPPAGFNPLTASDEALAAYGFPPRPDQKAAPGAYSAWERAMKASKERVFPVLELTNHFNGPNVGRGKTGNGTANSSNWSAIVSTTSVTSYGSNSFYWVQAEYVIPVASQAYGTCSGGWDYSSSWVGIDGWNSNDVLQAGSESDAYCNGGVQSTYYSAWYEWYPYSEVRITNFPVSPGDDMFVFVWSSSSTYGYAYLVNYNTDQATTIGFSAPSGTKLIGNSAEWVVERPGVGGGLATLTNYISDYFSSSYAETFGRSVYYPGTSSNILVTMLDDGGNPISYPTLLGSYGVWFQDEGSAR